MKKLIFALALLLAGVPALSGAALAAPPPMETKLILEACKLDADTVTPGAGFTLSFNLRNTNKKQLARNITVSVSCADGAVMTVGGGMQYLAQLAQGAVHTFSVPLKAAAAAAAGVHAVGVAVKFEDGGGMPLNLETSIPIEITVPPEAPQAPRLRTDTPEALPAGAADPVTVKVEARNLGRGKLYNLIASARGERLKLVRDDYGGNLDSGGSIALEVVLAFDAGVAEDIRKSDAWKSVKPGEAAPTLDYPSELLLSYEDEAGRQYTDTVAFTARANVPRPDEPTYDVPAAAEQGKNNAAPDLTGWIVAAVAAVALAGAALLALWRARKRSAR